MTREVYTKIKLRAEVRDALGPLGKQWQVDRKREVSEQILQKIADHLEHRRSGIDAFRALYQARLLLRLAAPIYPALQPILDDMEARMARIGEWAAAELRKRGQDVSNKPAS